jgi:2-polyprenyl-3-methyl-5-hydroxy-6-metoxy-1,4-benzoquinol methylase
VTDMDIYGDFTESDQAGIPGTMYRFLDLVNVSPEFQYYKRQMRPLLGLQPGKVVLDVGCGVGYESCRLAQEHPQVQIIGVDRETMVAEAARRAARLGVDVRWLSGAAEALPMPDASVDACITERVLLFLPNPAQGVAEMVRVLRPGGRIVSYEIDMAATILPGDPVVANQVVDLLGEGVGDARLGRRLPGLLRDAALVGISFELVAIQPCAELVQMIVVGPVRSAIESGRLPEARTTVWLDELVAANAAELFTVALIGWLCSGRLPD